MANARVKVITTWEGIIDIGDLPLNGLKALLLDDQATDHDVNVWELQLDRTHHDVHVEGAK